MSDSQPGAHDSWDVSSNGRHMPDPVEQTRAPQSVRYTAHAFHADQDEWVAAYAADELSADERAAFARHLGACASCQSALAQTWRIRALLSSLAFAAPTLDAATQPTGADDALAMSADQAPFVYADVDQPELSAPSNPATPPEWASRPLLPGDRVALPDARTGAADQGALADERLRAIRPGRLTTGANVTHSRRGATGAMDPNSLSGDPHGRSFANRFDDPTDNGAAHMRTAPTRSATPLPPTPTPRRRRPYVALATTLLLVALAAGVFGVLRARHGGPGTGAAPSPTVSHIGHATPAPTGVPVDPQTGLPQGASVSAIQMLSATDGWAAGSLTVKNGTDGIILHYTGGRWSIDGAPYPGLSLSGIAMVSDTEGWAVSGTITNQGQGAVGVILHDQAGHWTQSAPLANDALGKVVMVSPTEGWIIGSDVSKKSGSLILHIDNGAWTKVSNSLLAITDISMVSASDGWIVGNDGTIAHYQNGAWTRWPQSPIGTLMGVQMLSATDGWAVGFKAVSLPSGTMNTDPYIIHYDGASWQEVAEPSGVNGAQLNAVSMDSATDGWAVGQLQGQTSPNAPGVLFHYTNGQWVNVPLSTSVDLVSVSMVSATDGWAVGDAYSANNSISGSLILHYVNGVWTPYTA